MALASVFGIAFLLAALLMVGVLIGWHAQRSSRKRARQVVGDRVLTEIQNLGDRPEKIAASEELTRRQAEQMALREWDGGPPRQNWNRRVA
jgi:hypothetical protein